MPVAACRLLTGCRTSLSRLTAFLHDCPSHCCQYSARQGGQPCRTKGTPVRLRAPIFKGSRPMIVGLTVALVVVGGVGAWAVRQSSSSDAATPTLVSATTSTIRQSVSATGTIQPANRADLSFTVSGTVTSVPVAVGDQVKAGTVLATVDSASLQTAVSLAQIVVISTTSWVVEASVGSEYLPQRTNGMQAEITPTGSAAKVFGTVRSIGIVASSSSSGSASFPVTISVT